MRLRQEAAKTTCRVRRDGLLREISVEDLVEGDVVLLEAGEGIPADGWLRRGTLQCDQAALSGESREAEKTCAPLPEDFSRWDTTHPQQLFRGSTVTHGEGLMQVLRCGDRTLLGSMALSLPKLWAPTGSLSPPSKPLLLLPEAGSIHSNRKYWKVST